MDKRQAASFSFVRTLTVGSGVSPDLLTSSPQAFKKRHLCPSCGVALIFQMLTYGCICSAFQNQWALPENQILVFQQPVPRKSARGLPGLCRVTAGGEFHPALRTSGPMLTCSLPLVKFLFRQWQPGRINEDFLARACLEENKLLYNKS